MNERSFFAELKRRNVYKVAVAYAVVAWLLIQAASILFPTFEAPPWVMKVFVAVVLLGFPVALVLAWAFELTPEGIKRAEDVSPNDSIRRKTGRKMVGLTIALAIVATGLLLFQFTRSRFDSSSSNSKTVASATVPDKSIAVLPFENLSSDKENAYFAAGIQDEILTRLAKIGALKVISRSSTQQYQSKPGNLREIAQQLGVANILEGSVQKAGTAVHVNVQLIKAVTDDHLWAESYDRTLENIFGVEGEIAQTVAEALKAKLTGAEEKVLAQEPTSNVAAYDAYLRGAAQSRQRADELQVKAAQGSFEEAVRLDPHFAAAWAALSRTHSLLFFHYDATPARRTEAEKALAEALRLQPDLAEVQLARAYVQYWVRRDFTGSLELMRQLHTSWPNNAEVLEVMAYISARLGQWKESLDYIEQSMALNPKDPEIRIQALQIALAMRDFAHAVRLADDGLQIWPNNSALLGSKAFAFQARGQLNEAQSILDHVTLNLTDIDPGGFALMSQTLLRRDPAVALKFVASYPRAADEKYPKFMLYWAILQEAAGRKEDARASFARARDALDTLLKAQPQNGEFLNPLVFALAALGQREEALKALDHLRVVVAGDARSAGQQEELRARVLARFGDKEGALSSLERLLSAPADGLFGIPVTPAILRLDPAFDPLRGDPRFEKLAADKP
jgi:TolB-like protein/predicted Zn-dependent protease